MRRVLSLCLLAALPGAITVAFAQGAADAYPSKPVVLIIPAAPGGNTDGEMRLYSQRLGDLLGKPFVIDYKPGAGATIGLAFTARAPADGYTIVATNSSFTTLGAFHKGLTYDPVKDFQPISLLTKRSTLLLTHPNAPFKTLREYIVHARANPGKMNFGTTGLGSAQHLIAANLHDHAGIKVEYVHYKVSQAKTVDLLAGRIDVMFSSFFTSAGSARSGKLQNLAVMNPERSPMAPDWPTITEQGIPAEVEYPSWLGIQAPGGTPMPIVNKLNATLVRIVKEPEVSKRFEADSVLVIGSTPAQFRQHIVTEIARWRSIAEKIGVEGVAD